MKRIFLVLVFGLFLVGCSDDKTTQSFVEDTTKSVENIVQNASEVATNIAQDLQDIAQNVTQNIGENVDGVIEDIGQKTEKVVSQFVEYKASEVEDIGQKVEEIINDAQGIVSSSAVVVKEAQEKITEKVAQANESVAKVTNLDAGKKVYGRCIACHGTKVEKLPPGGNEIIKEWSASKIKEALIGYRAGTYGHKMKATMTSLVKNMSDEDFTNVSNYIQSLNQ
ncbi:MAG: c-type cytochrome [Campylobacteraceae bacterium]|jgi:cytochrome c553|nr:c-type cytochrome [Campylobacteraceae bacterium]